MKPRKDLPAAIIDLGGGTKLWIYGDAAEFGTPTVQLRVEGAVQHLNCLRPQDADRIADGLKLAARAARGEAGPTALDEFLIKRARPA